MAIPDEETTTFEALFIDLIQAIADQVDTDAIDLTETQRDVLAMARVTARAGSEGSS